MCVCVGGVVGGAGAGGDGVMRKASGTERYLWLMVLQRYVAKKRLLVLHGIAARCNKMATAQIIIGFEI